MADEANTGTGTAAAETSAAAAAATNTSVAAPDAGTAAASTGAAATTEAAAGETKAGETKPGETNPGETTSTEGAEKKETPAPVVPDKYELKLPADSTLDPAIMERTAATARALGLSNEAGQKMLDFAAAERSAAVQEYETARQPGGAVWTERDTALRTEALADKEIGGSAEKLAASAALAQQVVAKFAPNDAVAVKEFFDATGLGSHPIALKLLSRIGKSMGEGSLVLGGTNDGAPDSEAAKLARMYPSMAKK